MSEETLYDASAVQKIPFALSNEEGVEPLILTFQPISDDRYGDYDEATSVRITDGGEAMTSNAATPAGKLWDEIVSDAENLNIEGIESDTLPPNWREAFDLLQFKVPSLNKYISVAVYERPKTANSKITLSLSNERVIYADLYFNGEIVTTTHFLQKTDFKFAKELEKTQKIPLKTSSKGLREAGDLVFHSTAKSKADIYDKMKTKEPEGFVNNIVPLRVKAKIIDYIAQAVINQKK